MRFFPLLLCLGLAISGPLNAAEDTLYVRSRPTVPLLTTPDVAGLSAGQLAPGQAVTVLGRQGGFVNVALDDGRQGWLPEADLAAETPPGVRLTAVERELAEARAELDDARAAARNAESRLRQAERSAAAARESGVDEAAQLAAERDRLKSALEARENELNDVRGELAELVMAQEAERLLAAQQVEAAATRSFSVQDILLAGGAATLLTLLGLWLGASGTRRRIRRRLHGLEL